MKKILLLVAVVLLNTSGAFAKDIGKPGVAGQCGNMGGGTSVNETIQSCEKYCGIGCTEWTLCQSQGVQVGAPFQGSINALVYCPKGSGMSEDELNALAELCQKDPYNPKCSGKNGEDARRRARSRKK